MCKARVYLVFFVQLSLPPFWNFSYSRPQDPTWAQWRGPKRDGICQEKNLLSAWPKQGPELIWKKTHLGRGWSSPVFGEGLIFITGDIGDDLVVFALNEKGHIVWRSTNGRSWRGPYPGARACCAYYKGRLYNLNAHGTLTCFEAKTGSVLWSTNILKRFGGREITWGLSECLLVYEDRVFVCAGGTRALAAALDAKSGRTVWKTPPIRGDEVSHASPVIFNFAGRKIIASCSASHGFGVDAETGELLWTVPLRNVFGVNVATPVYNKGSVYYVTPYTQLGRKYRLVVEPDGIRPELAWVVPLDTVTGCSVLVNGVLYAAGYRRKKWWFAVDWETGRILSELRELTTGSAIYASGRLYCLDERGNVALVNPSPEDFKIVSKFRISERRINDAWAHPVIFKGRLYIRYHDTLFCYDIKK